MKELLKIKRLTMVLVFTILFSVITVFSVSGLDAEFENQIQAFPESYKVYLRELHEKYPLWEFEPFFTGLDWKTVIDKEHNDSALVYSSTAARVFKSLDADDYDSSSDYFYQKDGGFVAASRLAVEYFMDPRNFLKEEDIFQFEVLSFNEKVTVEMVEAVLYGSFMSQKIITYYDSNGNTLVDSKTYAEAIFEAGKTYDINPCFLAAKIRNEVGSSGSDSVSGKNSSYPGIYNFYNIGASDGAGAIERGLEWATGYTNKYTSYSRPWNTPYKSIMGGAEFLAEEYIAAGQFTGYLQRFNVNPDADYSLYSHQYMTNLTGALSQGYSSYSSYYSMGMLDTAITFSIPVYKNMSDEEGVGSLTGMEGTLQYGKISVLYSRVRKGPSTDYAHIVNSSGSTVYLDYADEVKILGKYKTDAYYPSDILEMPYWYKVSFTQSGKTYTGYVTAEYVDVTTAVYVSKGKTDISFVKSDSVKNGIYYSDPTMVKVIDEDTVEFLKNGTVSLYIYDSTGNFEEILFNVGNYSSYYPQNLKAEVDGSTLTVSVDEKENVSYYGFMVGDSNGKVVKQGYVKDNKAVITGLKSGSVYTVAAQHYYGKYKLTKTVSTTVLIEPQKVSALSFTKSDSGEATLNWKAVENAAGYQVLSYDESAKKYTETLVVPFGETSCTLTALQSSEENFVVRAYCEHKGKKYYGENSNMISLAGRPSMPYDVAVSSVTATSYRISWQAVDCEGYQLYYLAENADKYVLLKETSDTFVDVSGLSAGESRQYKVRAYRTDVSGKVYSVATAAVTAITLPVAPSGFTVKTGSNRALVSWSAVKGASGYTVYYKKDGGQVQSLETTQVSLMLNGLDGYASYQFAVATTVTKNKVSVTGKKTSAVKAVTKPSVPVGLKITSVGETYVNISWTKDSSLDTYKVFLLDSAGKTIGSKVLKENALKLSSLKKNTSYKVIIRGYKLVDGKYISSENSATLNIRPFTTKVSDITASALTETATIKWNKVDSAAFYQVYLNKNGSYELINTTTQTTYTLGGLTDCSTNYVAIRACFPNMTGDYYGETATYKFYTRPLSVEKITQSNCTDTSYTLSWSASSPAVNRYYVHRYNQSAKKFELLGSTSKTSCNLKNITPGTLHHYAVIAAVIDKDGKTLTSSKYTYYFTCATYLPKVQNIRQTAATENAVQFAWDAVEGATAYKVYRYDEAQKSFVYIGKTAKTVATLKNLEPTTQYIYRVNAVKETKNYNFVGYYSSALYASTK